MSRGLVLLVVLGLVGPAWADPGAVVWTKRLGGKGLDHGWGLTMSSRGELLVVGFGTDPIDLGGGVRAPRAADGIFVAAYDLSGKHHWSRRFPVEVPYYAGPIGATRDGAALIAGDFEKSLELDKPYPVLTQTMYLARVDGKRTDVLVQPGSALAVAGAADGGVVVAGKRPAGSGFVMALTEKLAPRWNAELPGTATSIGLVGTDTIVAGSTDRLFVMRLDGAGKTVWRHDLGDSQRLGMRAQLAVDSLGRTTVAYGGPAKLTVTRLDAAGAEVWSVQPGGINEGGIALDAAGGVAVSGDMGVIKLGPDGKTLWTRPMEAQELYPHGVAIDAGGRVYVTGWFAGTLKVGGKSLVSAGDYDSVPICLAP